ncbi:MAG: hypothetical protein P8Y69_18635 [Gammaproteobacteria bacterium]
MPTRHLIHIHPGEVERRSVGQPCYRPVFNLTGTIIHTNLGRALVSEDVYRSVEPLVTRNGPCR